MENLPNNKIKLLHNLVTEIGKKKENLNNSPQYSILLGAGCSTPTIPLAGKIIEMLRRKTFCNLSPDAHLFNKTSITEDEFISKRQKEFQDFVASTESEFSELNEIKKEELLKSLPIKLAVDLKVNEAVTAKWIEFKDKFDTDLLYGNWFEKFSENAETRQEFIEEIIQEHKPPAEYIILSFLIKSGYFKTIFTTNFDDFINESLINYTDEKPRVVAHNEPLTYNKFITKRPTVIKLHGDYLFENIKNIPDEVNSLEKNMFNKFYQALNLFGLVVVGYNGADASIMKAIEKIKAEKDFNLYWCCREGDNLHWRVQHLIETTKNCFVVRIKSFNELILQLWSSYLAGAFPIPDFTSQAEERKNIISKYLSQSVHQAKVEKTVSVEVIQNLEFSLDHLLPDNTFNKIRFTNDIQKRFEILKTYRIDILGKAVKSIFENDRVAGKSLFKKLYDQTIFKQKVIDAPIQHIGNAFSNLKEVDDKLTERIFLEIEDDIFIKKLETATPGLLNSALGELNSVNTIKTQKISNQLKQNTKIDYSNLSLLETVLMLSDVSRTSSFELLESIKDEVFIGKIKREKLDNLGFAFGRLNSISPTRTRQILYSIPNEVLISKIKESNLERIGQNLSVLEKISQEKIRGVLKSIESNILIDKLRESNLRDFASSLKEFSSVDRFYPKKLYKALPEADLFFKFEVASFSELCNGLVKLYKVDAERTGKAFSQMDSNYFANKLSTEKQTFEGTGAALLNLRTLDFNKASKAFQQSNFKNNLTDIAKSIAKIKEQSFFTFISTYLELNYEIGRDLIRLIDQHYLQDILKWSKAGQYTSKLPLLLRAFDELNLTEEARLISKVMCENQNLLTSKLGVTETEKAKQLISKYVSCK